MIASSVIVANKKFSEQENNQNTINTNHSNTNTPAFGSTKPSELATEEKNRGKRMMGVLMGTLSKFKSEEVDKSEANLKRILLEQKLAQKLQDAKINLHNQETRHIDEEASGQFQKTETFPVIFFKRAN